MGAKYIDKIETLNQVLDNAAIDGRITPAAIPIFMKAYRAEIVVDPAANCLSLHGKPLAEAVDSILAKEDFWKPKGGEENYQREQVEQDVLLERLKADALTGNATAHGRLFRQMDGDAYAQWCLETGAKPGTAITKTEVNGTTEHKIKRPGPTNPWSAAGWSLTAQMRLAKAVGLEKAAEIAAAAGCKIGSTKPNPAYNN